VKETNYWQIPGTDAQIYDKVFVPAMVAEWPPRLMEMANLKPGERVLDVACGTGILTHLAAEAVGVNGQAVGLDINADTLALARTLPVNSAAAAPIEWREGSASDLPFDSNSFDVVFCELGLMFFPDRETALQEMRRVLAPEGRLAIMVWGSLLKSPGQNAVKEAWERHFGMEQAALFVWQHSLGDTQIMSELLDEAGFRDTCAEAVMGLMRFPSAEYLVRSYGAMTGVQADDKTCKQIIHEVTVALQSYDAARDGGYPIEAILASGKK
jgi:SAM-dependent methyltransferase